MHTEPAIAASGRLTNWEAARSGALAFAIWTTLGASGATLPNGALAAEPDPTVAESNPSAAGLEGVTAESDQPVSAPSAASSGVDDRQEGALEVITVTARKRVEVLQETPVAATVLGGEKLELAFASDIKSFAVPAPNVTIAQMDFWSNAAAVAIRGITNTDIESTLDPPIAIFVDGVYIPRPAASNLDMFDVEKIEILRGPQGTLFGRNTTGGAVQVRTRRPTGELGFRGALKVGNYGRLDLKGALDFPIVDGVLNGKVAVLSQNSDGYFTSSINGKNQGGDDILAVRPMLEFTPSETFDMTLIGEYTRNTSKLWPGQNESDSTKLLCELHGYCGFPLGGGDEYEVALVDSGGSINSTIRGLTLEANWDVGPGTITSVSNYRETDEWVFVNGDMTQATMFELTRDQPHTQYSSELRFASTAWDKFDFVAGVYFMKQDYEIVQENWLTIVPDTPVTQVVRQMSQDHESHSVFFEGNYHFTDSLTGTVGGRYSKDTKKFEPYLFGPSPDVGPFVEVPEKSWDDFGPKLGLQYEFSPDMMAYASYTRGFKSGGFNGRCGQPTTCMMSFDPEEVDGYEVGLKSEFLDHRLRANLALFWSDYQNLQQTLIVPLPGAADPSETVTDNAAAATIKGVELELTAMVTPLLRVDLNVGYLDASYSEFCADLNGPEPSEVVPTSTCGAVTPVGDLGDDGIPDYNVEEDWSNLHLARAPKWNYGLNANWEIPVRENSLVLDARYAYTTSMYTDYRELSPRDAVGLLDASISYVDGAGRYRASLYGQNLTDETYVTARNLAAQLWTTRFVNPPRQWGVEFSVSF